jgi:hypothetical protein
VVLRPRTAISTLSALRIDYRADSSLCRPDGVSRNSICWRYGSPSRVVASKCMIIPVDVVVNVPDCIPSREPKTMFVCLPFIFPLPAFLFALPEQADRKQSVNLLIMHHQLVGLSSLSSSSPFLPLDIHHR